MQLIVGKVYANWCGHCHHLKPEWKKLKNMISNKQVRVQFIEIEESESAKRATFEKKIKASLNVSGFPTIFKVQFGKPVEYYTGPRTADAMRTWILSSSTNRKTRRNTFKRPIKPRNKSQKRWFPFL